MLAIVVPALSDTFSRAAETKALKVFITR